MKEDREKFPPSFARKKKSFPATKGKGEQEGGESPMNCVKKRRGLRPKALTTLVARGSRTGTQKRESRRIRSSREREEKALLMKTKRVRRSGEAPARKLCNDAGKKKRKTISVSKLKKNRRLRTRGTLKKKTKSSAQSPTGRRGRRGERGC